MQCVYNTACVHTQAHVCYVECVVHKSKRNRCGCYFGAIILTHSLSPPVHFTLFLSPSLFCSFLFHIYYHSSFSLFFHLLSLFLRLLFCSCIALWHGLHGWRMEKREALRHKRNECSNVILPYPYNHSVAAAAAAGAIAHSSSLVPFALFFFLIRTFQQMKWVKYRRNNWMDRREFHQQIPSIHTHTHIQLRNI